MSNRSAKFASALFAIGLAGACLASVSAGAARAAEECLAGPKGASPEGSHWFYRIDHATKRHCWYLGQRDKHAQAAARSTRSEKPIAVKKAESSTSRSIANARAELTASTRLEPRNQDDAGTRTAAQPTPAAETAEAAAAASNTPGSLVASRWPDFPPVSVPLSPPPPALAKLAANLSSDAAVASPTALAAVPLAAADTPREAGSVVMLLAVMSGALALAGLIASVVFKFGGVRRLLEPRRRPQRGSIWDRNDDDSIRPFSVVSFADEEEDETSTTRGHRFDPDNDRPERVAEFFTRLSTRAST
jgi:hypothetical protein